MATPLRIEKPSRRAFAHARYAIPIVIVPLAAVVLAQLPLPTTLRDFHVPGTQVGDVAPGTMLSPDNCRFCHGNFDFANEPASTWSGSLMGQAGRDPLFYAQMSLANQDAQNVGYYCLRCHVPQSIVTGHANQATGSTLNNHDRRGVDCHFCHSMVDPIYEAGVSPPEDESILADLDDVPQFFGNAMFVLDPSGLRRGPRDDADTPHMFAYSPFHKSAEMCGTCHDVGNVATLRQPDGSYRYNAIDESATNTDPWMQYPLERTYTEWKLSAFAGGGVDMGGRFGGNGDPVMRTCQDCHMPAVTAQTCAFGPQRTNVRRHDFAGAAAQVLDLIQHVYSGDPAVDPNEIAAGRAKAISMLERAASLEIGQQCGTLNVRVINESGHKLPTGHIEGRRVWVNAQFYDASDQLIREFGGYDLDTATLDELSTRIYEMKVGLSTAAAGATGLPAGETAHMALADTIWKDNRIPPRGFNNVAYEAGGAPVVRHEYADGQHWDELALPIPDGATRVSVTVNYQNLPRGYIEHLHEANHSDTWGQTLYDAWVATGKGPPIPMVARSLTGFSTFLRGDLNCDCAVGLTDLAMLLSSFGLDSESSGFRGNADLDGNFVIELTDLAMLLTRFGESCP